MASYCERCGEQVHGLPQHQPHLCKDIEKRLARREKQVQAVMDILCADGYLNAGLFVREKAEAIVKVLANLNVTED